jgi:hypothetical protein
VMILAATVFGLCLWPGLRAKRFTLGTVSFPSDDWIIFVLKFRFFKNLAFTCEKNVLYVKYDASQRKKTGPKNIGLSLDDFFTTFLFLYTKFVTYAGPRLNVLSTPIVQDGSD